MNRLGSAFALEFNDFVFELKFTAFEFGKLYFISPGARPFFGDIPVEGLVTAFEFGEMAFQC